MYKPLKAINLIKNQLNSFNSTRTIYDRHRLYVKGEKTIRVEEDDDQKLFAAYHFEPDFPYEHTKPLPQEKIEKIDSVLKNVMLDENEFQNKDPSMLEVQKLTYTSEVYWKKNHDFKKTYKQKPLKPRDGI